MSGSHSQDGLRTLWEEFLRVPLDSESRQSKCTKLERFLLAILDVSSKGHDIPKFSDMQSVSNILAGELLVDIDRVCSCCDDDDIVPLQEYLLRGRGSLILSVLNTIGVQGVTCSQELAEVLVSMLPYCFKFHLAGQTDEARTREHVAGLSLCKMEASLLRPITGCPTQHSAFTARSKVKHTSAHDSHLNLRKNTRNRFQSETPSSDSDTDVEYTKSTHHHQCLTSKPELLCGAFACVGITRDVLQPWVVDSGDSDASEDDFNVSKTLEMTPLQLCLLMLTVVKGLCQAGQKREEHKRLISAFIVPHLTRLLSNMTRENSPCIAKRSRDIMPQSNSGGCDGCSSGEDRAWSDTTGDSYFGANDESSSSEERGESFCGYGWTAADMVFVERYIVRIMVMLVSYLCSQSNGIAVVKASGCLTSWLDVAYRCMRSVTSEARSRENAACCVHLASDIVNGVLLLLYTIFSSIPLSPSILHMARDVFADFLNHDGLSLSENIILWYECQRVASDRTNIETVPAELISAVGKVISSLKLAKIDYIHTVKCTKRKHRKCNFDHFYHHHNDILNIESGERRQFGGSEGCGMSDSTLGTKTAPSDCAVAILGQFLHHLFERCESRCVKLGILSCVEDAGLCCCLSPRFVQSMFLNNLEDHPAAVRHRMLHVFTKVVLHQLGGAAAAQECTNPCVTCKDTSENTLRGSHYMKQETSDSAFSGSDVSQHEDEVCRDVSEPRWHCLKQLQPLVLNSDQWVGVQTMQHLLHLVRWGSPVVLYQLFQHVFLPVMQASRDTGRTQASGKVTHYCLIALPLLLRTPQAYNLFLNYSGVKQLRQLAQVVELRPCVLRVFQILIMLDDRISEQDSEIPSALSSESLHGRDSVVLDMFLHMLLTDNQESASKTIGDNNDTSPEEDSRHSDWLAAKSEQWTSCDSLFMQSHKFRHCFIERNGALIAYDTLTRSLSLLSEACDDNVVNCHYEGEECWFWQCLLLVQSTLNVCLACCREHVLFGDSEIGKKDILALVKQAVSECRWFLQPGGSAVMKTVCDVLVKSAVFLGRGADVIHGHMFTVTHLGITDSECDADSPEPCSDSSCSSYDSSTRSGYTELGYEADTEFTSDEAEKRETKVALPPAANSCKMRSPPCKILHPDLCRLVLELLAMYQDRDRGDVLPHMLLKLISLARHSPQCTTALYKQGVVEILLNGFKKVILSTNGTCTAKPCLVLELFLQLCQASFTASELTAFLKLFQEDHPPLDTLLSTLITVTKTFQLWPTYTIQFPVPKSSLVTDLELSVRSVSSDVLTASFKQITQSLDALSTDNSWTSVPVSPGVEAVSCDSSGSLDTMIMPGMTLYSPVRCAPLQTLLRDHTMWPTNQKGFGISLWLTVEMADEDENDSCEKFRCIPTSKLQTHHLEESSCEDGVRWQLPTRLREALDRARGSSRYWSEKCLHVVSLGNTDLLFEVWIDSYSANLIFRLVSHQHGVEKVMCETSIPNLLALDRWQHLTLSYSERVQGGRILGTVCAVMDGCYQQEVSMEYKLNIMGSDAQTDSQLMLGHAVPLNSMDPEAGSCQLGNLMLFKDTLLTKHTSFHLFALGPDTCTLSQCDSSTQTAFYSRHITTEAITHSGLSHDVFSGSHSIYIQHLRENLTLTYSPRNATMFNLYGQPSPFKLPHTKTSHAQQPQHTKGTFNPLLQQPTSIPARLLTDVAPQCNKGFADAVDEIGGISTFLFLFAKVVEQEGSEKQQARALRLLFTMIGYSSHYEQDFINMDGYGMLVKILLTPRCMVGYDLLKVLLDWCVTEPILQRHQGGYRAVMNTSALIRDVQLIGCILLAWRVWQRVDTRVWHVGLQALAALVRGDHPHRAFNVQQMQNVQLVHKITMIFLERIQDGCPSLSLPLCQSLTSIIQQLIGHPPDLHVVMPICDFLLLVHAAANTFVFHMPNSFYFTNKWTMIKPELRRPLSQAMPIRSHDRATTKFRTIIHSQSENEVVCVTMADKLIRPQSFPTIDSLNMDQRKQYATDTEMDVLRKRTKSFPPLGMRSRHMLRDDEREAGLNYVNVHLSHIAPGNGEENGVNNTVNFTLYSADEQSHQVPVINFPGSKQDRNRKDPGNVRHRRKRHSGDCSDSQESDEDNENSCFDQEVKSVEKTQDKKKSLEALLASHSAASPEMTDLVNYMSECARPSMHQDSAAISDQRWGLKVKMEVDSFRMSASSLVSDENDNSPLTTCRHEVHDGKAQIDDSTESSEDWVVYSTATTTTSVSVAEGGATLGIDREEDGIEEGEEGLVYLCTALLELLAQVLVGVTEDSCKTVTELLLKPEVILVMAHNTAPQVRVAVVQLLDVYLHRASCEQVNHFLKTRCFHLLANQLHQHEATVELAEACLTVVFGRPFSLNTSIDLSVLREASEVQKTSIVLTLALLESSADDSRLCQGILSVLLQIFIGVNDMAMVMLDNGLVETLCNLIHSISIITALANTDNSQSSPGLPPVSARADSVVEGTQVMLVIIQEFFCQIAEKTFSMYNASSYQYLEDSFTCLRLMQNKLAAVYGSLSEEVSTVCHIQCHMLGSVLNNIESRIQTQQVGFQLSSSLLSSAVGNFFSIFPQWPSNNPTPNSGNPVVAPSDPTKGHKMGSAHNDDGWSHRMFPVLGRKQTTLSQGELLDRIKKVVVMATDFVLFTESTRVTKMSVDGKLVTTLGDRIEVVSEQHQFARSLAEFLIKVITLGLDRSFFHRRSTMSAIMWQAKDLLRIQFSRLLTHLLRPSEALCQRINTVELLASEPRRKDILKLTLSVNGVGAKLVYFLYELLWRHLDELLRPQRSEVDDVMDVLQQLGLSPLRLGTRISPDLRNSLEQDARMWEKQLSREKAHWKKRTEQAAARILHRLDSLSKKVTASAMDVTRTVNNMQNVQRKKFLEHVKSELTHSLHLKRGWQHLIQQLTHERAVWHCAKSYPSSWQLDPTEGPCRIRKRTQRCHLGIASRFLRPEYRHKLDSEKFAPPLSFLFQDGGTNSDSATLLYKLHTSENIQYTCVCVNVTPSSETSGALLIGHSDVYFVADQDIMDVDHTQSLVDNKDLFFLQLPHDDIKEIHRRRYQLKDNALEIFLTNGKTCLIAFSATQDRDELHSQLVALRLPNVIETENLTAVQQYWLDGRITNFEYLSYLNKMAGRSFNDLMQYPVLPFILAKYTGNTLDLDDSQSYRNLAKPISVQDKLTEQKHIDKYKYLEREKLKPDSLGDLAENRPAPYHYGSHYSNSGTVLHFLVRLPPFTQMFLHYQENISTLLWTSLHHHVPILVGFRHFWGQIIQVDILPDIRAHRNLMTQSPDNQFDLPDRTFHSMETTWRLASFKELIPEFFFLPDFLCNDERFNLGVRQSGHPVSDVTLPPWCHGDARRFVLIHRQALESDYVSANISAWIDLIFGFKQTGRAAIDAINVFHPATYFGIDVESIADPVGRNATRTMIKTYGQTPKKLFRHVHPSPHVSGRESGLRGYAKSQLQPLRNISGLKWGNYVGSPDWPDPMLSWMQPHGSAVSSLVALPTGEVFGLGPSSCLIVMYSKEKGVTAMRTVDVLWAAIVSWGHADSIIRLKNRKDLPAVNFMHYRTHEQVTCCASVPDCRLLFFADTSGVISVYKTKFNPSKQSHLQVLGHGRRLYGHTAAIVALYVCKPFSIMVSASLDHTCIIWDINRLCYVRSIMDHRHALICVSVSDTLGDIASVSHTDHGSCLMLHTVNAQHISSAECDELILCLSCSTAPEGRSVNVIAGGLSNGVIRLWSLWDLMVVRDIRWKNFTRPVVSLTFTPDAQRLFAANTDGTVVVWELPATRGSSKDVIFIPFL